MRGYHRGGGHPRARQNRTVAAASSNRGAPYNRYHSSHSGVNRYHSNINGNGNSRYRDSGRGSYAYHGNNWSATVPIAPTPSELVAVGYSESNSNRIWQLFVEKRQTDATYERKLMLRDALLTVVSSTFHSAGICIVGSSMNGFGTNSTDLDLCLVVTSQDFDQKREATVVLTHLLKPLRQCRFLRNISFIRAKVPIIKFHDTVTQLDCDLNINNLIGVYNTHLMAAYAKCDWRVRPLVMFVKLWAQSLRVQDASQGRLSSYSLALMTVHYLQAGCSPSVLPCLQALYPQLFNYDRPYAEVDMRLQLPWDELRSQNGQNLGQLFAGFVRYYAEFDWRGFSVSVRLGKPLPIQLALRLIPAEEQLRTSHCMNFKIYVEEPFSFTNAARSVHSDDVFAQIQRAFRSTARSLQCQRSLSDILNNPA